MRLCCFKLNFLPINTSNHIKTLNVPVKETRQRIDQLWPLERDEGHPILLPQVGIRHLVLDGHPRDLADLEGFGVGLARPHLGEVEEDDADVEALGATRLAQRGVRVELAVAGRDIKIFTEWLKQI